MPVAATAVASMTAHAVARWKRGNARNVRTAASRGMPKCVGVSSARSPTARGMPRCGNVSRAQTRTRRGMPRCAAASSGREVRNIENPMDIANRGRRMRPAIVIPATNRPIAIGRKRRPAQGAVMPASSIANHSSPYSSRPGTRSTEMLEAAAGRFMPLVALKAGLISRASSIGASSCSWELRGS